MTDDRDDRIGGIIQSVRTRVSDNGRIVRFWHVVNGQEEKLFDLDAGGVDSLVASLLERRPKMDSDEKPAIRANHHQLLALATFLRNKSNGNKFSAEWQWSDIAISAAEQQQEFVRLKDFLKQLKSVERAIDRILDAPK